MQIDLKILADKLRLQRNTAQDEAALMAAAVDMLQARVTELEKEIAELKANVQ